MTSQCDQSWISYDRLDFRSTRWVFNGSSSAERGEEKKSEGHELRSRRMCSKNPLCNLSKRDFTSNLVELASSNLFLFFPSSSHFISPSHFSHSLAELLDSTYSPSITLFRFATLSFSTLPVSPRRQFRTQSSQHFLT